MIGCGNRERFQEISTRNKARPSPRPSATMTSMALHDRVRKLTYDDYALIPEDGQRHEIIDGEHYMTPSPVIPAPANRPPADLAVGGYREAARVGRVFAAPCGRLFSKHDIVQPDLLFISKERLGIVADKNVQGAPDLVVEILPRAPASSTRRSSSVSTNVLVCWSTGSSIPCGRPSGLPPDGGRPLPRPPSSPPKPATCSRRRCCPASASPSPSSSRKTSPSPTVTTVAGITPAFSPSRSRRFTSGA